jgi:hypothetical protein
VDDLFGGVWGSGPSDVWIGGDSVIHWDGTAWSLATTGFDESVNAIWGTQSDDVWFAVGGSLRHWNGTAWSISVLRRVHAIWASGPADVWALPSDAVGSIIHWNGSTWSNSQSGTSSNLYGTWGVGSNDVWIVGDQGTTLHHN